jgi:hypothetical protein
MVKRIIKYLLFDDHFINKLVKSVYYHSRYYYSRFKILIYCRMNDYPVSKIFLEIPASSLNYTEFNKSGHRDISSRNIYRIIGKVIDGDWDLNRTHIHDWTIYKALKEFLKDGKDLMETDYYKNEADIVGKPRKGIWHRITDKNYMREKERNRKLFHMIKDNGFKTQKDLGGVDPLDEIRVKIGRDGEFLWENSIHRFVIVKLLNIYKISVVVTVRHLEWVRLKKKLIELAREKKSERHIDIGKKYDHPDLRDIPYCSEGEEKVKEHMRQYSIRHVGRTAVEV